MTCEVGPRYTGFHCGPLSHSEPGGFSKGKDLLLGKFAGPDQAF